MEDKGFDRDFVSKTDWPWLLCTYAIPSQYSENRSFTFLLKKKTFLCPLPYSSLSTHKKCILSYYTQYVSLLCFPKNIIPLRDSNPELLVPEADGMSTALRRQFKSEVSH
jgi:hypothetical protein